VLCRKFGLAVDNLISADIVTADGKLRTVSATQEPDLFWAIRGGGGKLRHRDLVRSTTAPGRADARGA
jgi:FAD/FMN-containing dehydrogenase